METPKGYLFKRWRGKHLPADSAITATYYFSFERDGKRETLCLHTTEREQADRLVSEHMGRLAWGSREAYLRSLIEMGERAKRELWGLKHDGDAVKVGEMWEKYVASRRRPDSGPGTMGNYRAQLSRFLKWLPASVKTMRQVNVALAEEYVRELERKVRQGSAVQALGTMRRVWRVLDPDGPQPWNGLCPVGGGVVRPYRRLSHGECASIVRAAGGVGAEERGMVVIGYYTALRMADAVAVRVEHVDLKGKVLHLPAPRKTSRRKPAPLHIPILPELGETLKGLMDGKAQGALLPELLKRYERDQSGVSKEFVEIFRAAGVENTDAGRASFHSLRSTFVSAMDEAGAPPRVTDLITNHAPRSMHDRYSHPDVEVARKWMAKALKRLGDG